MRPDGADMARQRRRMVEQQIAGRGIRDPGVLDAMARVPREHFVSDALAPRAYDDSPLPIGHGQTISQPYIVALMLEAAALKPSDRVLEIGAGSGYASAIASLLSSRVVAIERHPQLAELGRERMHRLGYRNVEIHCGDGSGGWPDAAPFDAILVAAAGPRIPEPLRDQLAIGGRLVMPVGEAAFDQRLTQLTRLGEADFRERDLCGVVFVPLIGSHGWPAGAEEP